MVKIFSLILKIFGFTNEIHYINGASALPPPLNSAEESKYIESIETPESRKALVEHNLRLVVYIAKKFESAGVTEDLVSIGTIGLIKAVNTYKSDKQIKLATYASRCIENEILMYIRKTSGQKAEISLDEPLNVDWDGNELCFGDLIGDDENAFCAIEEKEDKKIIRSAVNNLPERERTLVELRFGFARGGRELTQKEVADIMGISQSYISRLEKKIMEKLKSELAKLSY